MYPSQAWKTSNPVLSKIKTPPCYQSPGKLLGMNGLKELMPPSFSVFFGLDFASTNCSLQTLCVESFQLEELTEYSNIVQGEVVKLPFTCPFYKDLTSAHIYLSNSMD